MKNVLKGFIKRGILGRFIRFRGNAADSAVYLTFDDGPHPEYTPRLLEALRKEGAKATFFLNGAEVEKYPDVAAALAREGHAVGNHFFSHRSVADLSRREMEEEIARGEAAIQKATGKFPGMIRPPYGTIDAKLLWYAWRRGRKLTLWTVDPKDGDTGRDAFRGSEFLSGLGPGDIILLHDDNPHTIEALPGFLRDLKSRGLRLAPLPEPKGL